MQNEIQFPTLNFFVQLCRRNYFLLFGIWYLELGTWYLVLGTWYLVLSIWCLALGIPIQNNALSVERTLPISFLIIKFLKKLFNQSAFRVLKTWLLALSKNRFAKS